MLDGVGTCHPPCLRCLILVVVIVSLHCHGRHHCVPLTASPSPPCWRSGGWGHTPVKEVSLTNALALLQRHCCGVGGRWQWVGREESFYAKNTTARPRERQFWQPHGISLNVHHAVTLPELAISWLKELQPLPKGARGSNVLKLGMAKMVHWSVRGSSLFSGYFAVGFFECGKKAKKGTKINYWPPIMDVFIHMVCARNTAHGFIVHEIKSEQLPKSNSWRGQHRIPGRYDRCDT